MIVVLQRVKSASVTVDGKTVGAIDHGLLLLIGIAQNDDKHDVEYVADKCVHMRIFSDVQGKMNRSLLDVKGAVLAISQFTLLGDSRKGRRPSFIEAADPEKGNDLYRFFVNCLRKHAITVETGIFGAMIQKVTVGSKKDDATNQKIPENCDLLPTWHYGYRNCGSGYYAMVCQSGQRDPNAQSNRSVSRRSGANFKSAAL
jgi:D-tyrosyl-tRNA(Tyr) deacylase